MASPSTRSSTSHIARTLTWAMKNRPWIEGSTKPILEAVTRRYNEDNDDLKVSPRTMQNVLKEAGIKFAIQANNSGFITGRSICTNLFIQVNTLGQMVEKLYEQTRTPVSPTLRDTFLKAAQDIEVILSQKKTGEGD